MKKFLPTFVLIFLAHIAALACQCNSKPSIKEAFTEAKAVFIGRCISAKVASKQLKDAEPFEYRQFTFKATRVWKGSVDKKEIIVSTGEGGTDCGVQYELGGSYVVYCAAVEDELFTNICMRGCGDGGPEAEAEKKGLDEVAKSVSVRLP